MGIFGKIKNALFTEEEETVEIPVIEQEVKEEHVEKPIVENQNNQVSRFSNFDYQDNETNNNTVNNNSINNINGINKIREEEIVVAKEEKKEIEDTNNSPFQTFDEEEFDRIAAINKNRLIERDRRAREEKEKMLREKQGIQENVIKSSVQSSSTKIDTETEQPKFKPTPVISPVYGILDKNYTKEDILPKSSSDGVLPKVMDVDQVRRKAFGTLGDDIDTNIKNIDDIKITSFEDQVDEDTSVLFTKDEIAKAFEEDKKEEEKKAIKKEVKKVEKAEVKEEINDVVENDVKVEDDNQDDLEKDLFNLIDSMYQNEEGEK